MKKNIFFNEKAPALQIKLHKQIHAHNSNLQSQTTLNVNHKNSYQLNNCLKTRGNNEQKTFVLFMTRKKTTCLFLNVC